jgi:hypothetical protein
MWCWNLKKINEIFLPLFLKRDHPALQIKETLSKLLERLKNCISSTYRTFVVENVGLEKVVEAAQVVVVSDQQHLGPSSSSLKFVEKNISSENKFIAIIHTN